jgi:hypothetical protein
LTKITDFRPQLRQQLTFLERSCALYDAGAHDEALRLASTLRTLIHHTPKSTSLLVHLKAGAIDILSTARPHVSDPSEGLIASFANDLGNLTVHHVIENNVLVAKMVHVPQLDDCMHQEFIPLSKWWTQVVANAPNGDRLTRKQFVLAAANKDGGVHVDEILPANYSSIAGPGGTGVMVSDENGNCAPDPEVQAHYINLRQIAYEILNSPKLLALLK